MTSALPFMVFEDFNEPTTAIPAPGPEPEPAPAHDLGPIREAAWTDGYLTGRQERADGARDASLTAQLLTSVHALDATAAGAAEAAALAVAGLLVNAVITATDADWPAQLMTRVRAVADRVKPALTVQPAFELRDAAGIKHCFDDISELSRAVDDGMGEDVSIRWQHGEALISRTALLEDLRQAIVPLTAGRPPAQSLNDVNP